MQVFFFKAEDAIRYGRVTGVQTCALPISAAIRPIHHPDDLESIRMVNWPDGRRTRLAPPPQVYSVSPSSSRIAATWLGLRSEERRVGNECNPDGALGEVYTDVEARSVMVR